MPRKYAKVKHLEDEIFRLKAAGKTNGEIREITGLTKKQLTNLITRHNRREKEMQKGIPVKRRGRPRKTPLTTRQELEMENKQLKMEVELLRSFLQAAGRR